MTDYWKRRTVTHLILFTSIASAAASTGFYAEASDNGVVGIFMLIAVACAFVLVVQAVQQKRVKELVSWQYLKSALNGQDTYPLMPVGGPIMSLGGSVEVRHQTAVQLDGNTGDMNIAYVRSTRPLIEKVESTPMYAVDYLVTTIPTSIITPHMFIDGRSQNRFRRNSRDLWLINSQLGRDDRLQKLEGDFSQYFDVYVAGKDSITGLSILTPDTMLRLRDKGFAFDIELCNGYIHMAHSTNFSSQSEIDDYVHALKSCLDEILPQLYRRTMPNDGTLIQTSSSRLALQAVVNVLGYALLRAFLIIALACLYVFSALLIGGTIGSILQLIQI